jgi:CRP/FNR family transcriptional regulator
MMAEIAADGMREMSGRSDTLCITPQAGAGQRLRGEDRKPAHPVYADLMLGRRKLRELFANSHPRLLKPGELLNAAGSASGEICWLCAGWAYQFRELHAGARAIVDVYLPGDIIGLDAVLDARSAQNIAMLSSATIAQISAEDTLTSLMADRPTALYIVWLLSRQQRRADRFLAAMARLDARGRVATMLLDFYMRLRRHKLITGLAFNLPVTQKQIGHYLGVTVVHLNRVFGSLRAERIVSLEKHCVTILDLGRLRSLAQYGAMANSSRSASGKSPLPGLGLAVGKPVQ